MRRPTLRQRARYWFDNTMSRGTPALIGWLAIVSVALVVTLSALIAVADRQRTTAQHTVSEIWKNVVETFKLGGADTGNPAYRVLVIALALAGVFFASTLISLLTSGVNRKLTELRKGRSVVLEKGHTVLLGWSDQVFTIITELMEANSNQRRACVAILAARDRSEMEDEIRKVIGHTGNTRVVCRTGDPMDPDDIDIVNPQAARSIIVVTPPRDAPDPQIIKTLLAITNSPTRRKEPYHVVAAIREARNRAAASLAGVHEAIVIDSDDIAARLIVQTCRQSGLSVVYTDLLDFDGDEIYMTAEPQLTGHTFGDALLGYRKSSVIGLRRGEQVMVKPPMNTVIADGDEIIAVSADDDTVVLSGEAADPDESAIVLLGHHEAQPERSLIIGWNRRAINIVQQLNNYVPDGSTVHVVADEPDAKRQLEVVGPGLENLDVTFEMGDTDDRGVLERLEIGSYDHVVVLCYDHADPQYADTRALITLLHLREMQAQRGEQYSIVSEMSDDRNRRLAQVTQADDFIVSEKLISLLMTQLSENRHLAAVFADLFDSAGSEIYLKRAEEYVKLGEEIDFHTVVESARRREEAAIGYRIVADSTEAPTYGVNLNPDKSGRVTFAAGDRVIVLAED